MMILPTRGTSHKRRVPAAQYQILHDDHLVGIHLRSSCSYVADMLYPNNPDHRWPGVNPGDTSTAWPATAAVPKLEAEARNRTFTTCDILDIPDVTVLSYELNRYIERLLQYSHVIGVYRSLGSQSINSMVRSFSLTSNPWRLT